MNDATRLSLRICRLAARLFPEEFRALHSQPLLATSEDLIRDVAARRGLAGLIPMMDRLLVDIVVRVVAEHLRDVRQDTHQALRVLGASPGFTLAAVLSVALGLGVSIGVLSQIQSMVLAPISGVREPESLVTAPAVSFPVYEAVSAGGPFAEVASFTSVPAVWNDDGRVPRRIWAHVVTPNYFDVLGTRTGLGRTFSEGEDPGSVILNERLWREHLGADPEIIGRPLRLNGQSLTVVGVAEASFNGTTPFSARADVWLLVSSDTPFVPASSTEILEDREMPRFALIGRLRPDTPVSEAEAYIDTIARGLVPPDRRDDADSRGRQVSLLHGGRRIPIADRELPVVLGVTAVLVFLMLGVAAANVGTLLLARAAARRREVAIRLGLGASRLRVLRQFLTESLVLALFAGLAGYGFAWGYKAILDFAMVVVGAAYGTAIEPLPMGAAMLGLSMALSLGSGLMFGIAPAFHAVRTSMAEAMRPGTIRLGRFRWWSFRNLLVLQQVAGSLALLLLTGFVVLGVIRTSGSDPGFDATNLHLVSLDPIRDGYSRESAVRFLEELPDRVRQLPGVQSAALSYDAPVGLRSAEVQSVMEASTELDAMATLRSVQTRRIGYGFLETLALPVIQGESFGPADRNNRTAPRVLVNETLARGFWTGGSPIGQTLELGAERYTVAGVVPDLPLSGIMARTPPTAFRLLTDDDLAAPSAFGTTLVVRTTGGDPIEPLRAMLRVTDPDVVLFDATTVEREAETGAYLGQINMLVYGGIGLFGLVLAAVGVSGITAYAVVARRKEIGIRLALGASRGRILGLVTHEAVVLVGAGMAVGLGLAYAGARLLGAWFSGLAEATGTTTSDPILLVGAPALLGLLTMAGSWLPAVRALRIDPAVTLREE